jgi:hypothetical protein
VPTDGSTYYVEVWVNVAGTNADSAQAVVTYDPSQLTVTELITPTIAPTDLAFKSPFFWLPSLGQPDTVHLPIPGLSFPIPGLLLIIMTVTSFVSQRMTTMPTEDPQQQAMMRSMAFMPLMYLFFFVVRQRAWCCTGSPATSSARSSNTSRSGSACSAATSKVTAATCSPVAHLPASTVPAAALVGDAPGNGRVESNTNHKDGRTPGSGSGASGATRRPRPGQSKGRKRGKR